MGVDFDISKTGEVTFKSHVLCVLAKEVDIGGRWILIPALHLVASKQTRHKEYEHN